MTGQQTPLGVLLMAYGTPRSADEIEPYYTHIRHGHPPTPELLGQLIRRYDAIGGVSPLNQITQAQGEGLERVLNTDSDRPYKVYLGMKHAVPFIAQAIHQMVNDGIKEAVCLVLAPHYSSMSVGEYQKEARFAAEEAGLRLLEINSWHLDDAFIRLLARRVENVLQRFKSPERVMVLFSAHSLPQRILAMGDPYPQQLRQTADAVAGRLNLSHYDIAWQSAGRTPEPWIGPDILDALRHIRRDGYENVIICPAGFVSDHLEVLYDIDVECQQLASDIDLSLARTQSLNADPEFLQLLADLVRARSAHDRWNESEGGGGR